VASRSLFVHCELSAVIKHWNSLYVNTTLAGKLTFILLGTYWSLLPLSD
jgi:hypothetical protein